MRIQDQELDETQRSLRDAEHSMDYGRCVEICKRMMELEGNSPATWSTGHSRQAIALGMRLLQIAEEEDQSLAFYAANILRTLAGVLPARDFLYSYVEALKLWSDEWFSCDAWVRAGWYQDRRSGAEFWKHPSSPTEIWESGYTYYRWTCPQLPELWRLDEEDEDEEHQDETRRPGPGQPDL